MGNKYAAWQDEVSAAMAGGDVEMYKKLRDPEYLDKVIFGLDDMTGAAQSDLRSLLDTAFSDIEHATRAVSGSKKRQLMYDLVEPKDPMGSVEGSINLLARMNKDLSRLAQEGRAGNLPAIKAAKNEIDR